MWTWRVTRIELRLEEKPKDFTGLVVDVNGRPIPRVRVAVTCGGHGSSRSTDPHGQFTFEGVYATGNPLKLTLSRRGYLRTERKDVVITKGVAPMKFRLLLGYDLKISFVDPKGERIPVMWCGVAGGVGSGCARLEPGVLRLEDLPAGPQTITADIGGRRYERKHDPVGESALRWELPAMGHIQVEVPRPTDLKYNAIRAVITAQSDGKSFEERFIRGAPHEPTIATQRQLLLPGKYKVWVKSSADGQVHLPAREFTVKPGKLTLCRFGER